MKKVYLTIAALLTWAMTSVAALAVDIIVVSHGQANDPFWSVAKNGVDKACKDMKVSCKYTAPATFDMVEKLIFYKINFEFETNFCFNVHLY